MQLILPRNLLNWIDENRGEMSRQLFIIKCMYKLKEVQDMTKQNSGYLQKLKIYHKIETEVKMNGSRTILYDAKEALQG